MEAGGSPGRPPSSTTSGELSTDELVTELPDNLLFHGNAPWAGTGYGQQAGINGMRIAKLGYNVAFSAFFGLKGSRHVWPAPDGTVFPVYPGGVDAHGNDVLGGHAKHWFAGRGGIVLALTDPWVLHPDIAMRLPLVMWSPVDHDPLIPGTDKWFKKTGAIPVAMSKFGKRVLEEAGHENVQYVPHSFDPDVFKPRNRVESRRALGIPQSAFVVGMVAANVGQPGRKSFTQAFEAFSIFSKRFPDALLYLHTKLEDDRGEDLPGMIKGMRIRAQACDQYGLMLGIPTSVMAATHSAFDVLLNPSMGEGFGCALMEAQACGTPVISTNFSSMPEVAPVSAGNWTGGGQATWTYWGSKQVTPSVDEIVNALVSAYEQSESERTARKESVWRWVNSEYRADDVVPQYWTPTLQHATEEFAWRKQLLVR